VHAVTQLEISSTGLRDIITSGRDPRFLVPEPVRTIILETGCYARTP
jgi:nicotinate-nucleotide adenylyltransferase